MNNPDINQLWRSDQLAQTERFHRKQKQMAQPLTERGKGSPVVSLSDAEYEKLMRDQPPIDMLGRFL